MDHFEARHKKKAKDGLCIFANQYKLKRTPISGFGYPTFVESEEMFQNIQNHLQFGPGCTSMHIFEFLDDYKDILKVPFSDDSYNVKQEECSKEDKATCLTCPVHVTCPFSSDYKCSTIISVSTHPNLYSKMGFYSYPSKGSRTITLNDIRLNNRPVSLCVKYPRVQLADGTQSLNLIRGLRFLEHRITTRLATAVANLAAHCSLSTIALSYNLTKTVVHSVLHTWTNLCTTEPDFPDDNRILIHATIKDTPFIFELNAQTRALSKVYEASEFVNFSHNNVYDISPQRCILLSPVNTRDLSDEFEPLPFYINDVYTYLYHIFKSESRAHYAHCRTVTFRELTAFLEESFEVLKHSCAHITAQLAGGYLSSPEARSRLEKQLKLLSILANTYSDNMVPQFPKLLDEIQSILSHKLRVLCSPDDYYGNRYARVLDADVLTTWTSFERFIEAINDKMPDDADLDFAILRICTFNEAAMSVCSHSDDGSVVVKSVFSALTPQDFYQPHVNLSPTRLDCLTHLINCGMLDTNAPYLTLPCIQERLKLGSQSTCQLEYCPLLAKAMIK